MVGLLVFVEIATYAPCRFGVAEQAIGAIYVLSKHPDSICSDILRRKTRLVFQKAEQQTVPAFDEMSQPETGLPSPPPEAPSVGQRHSQALSQLLFIVGHMAIKQIVHLELCELDFKRRKAEKEKTKVANASPSKGPSIDEQELDLIGGTTEDDFTEAGAYSRERAALWREISSRKFWTTSDRDMRKQYDVPERRLTICSDTLHG